MCCARAVSGVICHLKSIIPGKASTIIFVVGQSRASSKRLTWPSTAISGFRQKKRQHRLCVVLTDSQSIKIAPMIYEDKGVDGNKKINGRKRQLLVDTQGLIWAVFVHAANLSDSVMGCHLLSKAKGNLNRLEKILVDAGYRGLFTDLASEYLHVKAEISSKPPTEKGFVPVAKRWVNERTFGWFNFFRRLSKDYEHSTRCAESMVLLANCAIVLNRIN